MGFLSRQFFSPVAVGLGMPAKPLVATSSSVRSSGQLQFPSRQAAFPHPFFFSQTPFPYSSGSSNSRSVDRYGQCW